jgi:hypothetical protein
MPPAGAPAPGATDQPGFGPAPRGIGGGITCERSVVAEKGHHAGCAVCKTGEALTACSRDTLRQRPRTLRILRAHEVIRARRGTGRKPGHTEAPGAGECCKPLTRSAVSEVRPIKATSECAGEMRVQCTSSRNTPGLYRRRDRKRAAGAPVYETGQVGRYRGARGQHAYRSFDECRIEVRNSGAVCRGQHVQQSGDARVCIDHCRVRSRALNPQSIEPPAEFRCQPLESFGHHGLVRGHRE